MKAGFCGTALFAASAISFFLEYVHNSKMSIANGPHVVIIGAGLGGITTAIGLKTKLKYTNFTIIEKAASIGGTWRDNTYPGCTCDIPVHWYSLSTELNPDWKEQFASQRDILEYWQKLYQKYNLGPSTIFNTTVVESTWDQKRQIWLVKVEKKTESGVEESIIEANLIVSAVGSFSVPTYANIQGRDRFKGIHFHSSRWDHSVDLSGKKVGVIGNGCSSAQIVPAISEDPSVQVVNICRTPVWLKPRGQSSYSSLVRWIFRNIPGAARLYRNFVAMETDSRAFFWKKRFAFVRKIVEYAMLLYMRFNAPKKHHKDLTPDYPMGCKRVILDPGYYKCLNRPNVDLAWGGVKEILEDGLITGKGQKYQFDVIVYGTGFKVVESNMNVIGRDGQSLSEFFKSKGGAEAYLATTYPHFPNFFTLFGPNLATGHTSVIFGEEMQINYILQLMKPVLDGNVKSYEVKEEALDRYNVDLQKRISQTTWTQCHSHYQTGEDMNGKNIVTFPGSAFRLWRLFRKANIEDYICVAGNVEDKKRV